MVTDGGYLGKLGSEGGAIVLIALFLHLRNFLAGAAIEMIALKSRKVVRLRGMPPPHPHSLWTCTPIIPPVSLSYMVMGTHRRPDRSLTTCRDSSVPGPDTLMWCDRPRRASDARQGVLLFNNLMESCAVTGRTYVQATASPLYGSLTASGAIQWRGPAQCATVRPRSR